MSDNIEEMDPTGTEVSDGEDLIEKEGFDYDDFEDDEEEQPRERMVSIRVRNELFFAILIPIIFILGLFTGYVWRGRDTEALAVEMMDALIAQAEGPADAAPAQAQGEPVRYDVPIDDDPVMGPDDAPVTIIEFSDFQCPYCTQWHNEVFARLIADYGDKIRFVYRDFPLTNIHPEAFPAAEAANCAGEQNMYWEFHDLLFSNGPNALSAENYVVYAESLDLDLEDFKECVDSGRYKDEVQGDIDFAANLGIRSTPTFFINGLAVVGAQPYEVFQRLIDRELAGSN